MFKISFQTLNFISNFSPHSTHFKRNIVNKQAKCMYTVSVSKLFFCEKPEHLRFLIDMLFEQASTCMLSKTMFVKFVKLKSEMSRKNCSTLCHPLSEHIYTENNFDMLRTQLARLGNASEPKY